MSHSGNGRKSLAAICVVFFPLDWGETATHRAELCRSGSRGGSVFCRLTADIVRYRLWTVVDELLIRLIRVNPCYIYFCENSGEVLTLSLRFLLGKTPVFLYIIRLAHFTFERQFHGNKNKDR